MRCRAAITLISSMCVAAAASSPMPAIAGEYHRTSNGVTFNLTTQFPLVCKSRLGEGRRVSRDGARFVATEGLFQCRDLELPGSLFWVERPTQGGEISNFVSVSSDRFATSDNTAFPYFALEVAALERHGTFAVTGLQPSALELPGSNGTSAILPHETIAMPEGKTATLYHVVLEMPISEERSVLRHHAIALLEDTSGVAGPLYLVAINNRFTQHAFDGLGVVERGKNDPVREFARGVLEGLTYLPAPEKKVPAGASHVGENRP